MSIYDSSGNPRYIARIDRVRELTLLGTADLTIWSEHLRADNLRPTARDGRAEVLISAIEAKFMGVNFREMTISVSVCRHDDGVGRDGLYLAAAFNSSRFFTFVERRVFHTPYRRGSLSLNLQPPASFRLADDGVATLEAEWSSEVSTTHRETSWSGEDDWEGPIFLPANRPGDAGRRRLFFGRVGGYTQIYPFSPAADVVKFQDTKKTDIVHLLRLSRFVGESWIVRSDASHARSGTVSLDANEWPRRAGSRAALTP